MVPPLVVKQIIIVDCSPVEQEKMTPLMTVLRHTLTCDLRNTTPAIWSRWTGFLRRESRSTPYIRCIKEQREGGITNDSFCISLLTEICTNSSMIIVKTIRTPMYLVGPLLESLPKLKVIYYTRDPRGMINSRSGISKSSDILMVKNAERLCLTMSTDYAYYRTLSEKHPDRIIHVKYESLAHSPMECASMMYKYVDKELVEDINRWITKNTVKAFFIQP